MKNFTIILTTLLLLTLFSGCDNSNKAEPPTPAEPKFEVTPTSLSFVAKGETKSFNIITTGDWTATSSEKWCTISKTNGNGNATIEVLTSENDEVKTRNAKIIVKQGRLIVEVAISQLGVEPDILVDESPRKLNNSPGVLTVEVTTNTEYDIEVSEKWIQLKQSKAMVKYTHDFAYDENVDSKARSAKITIKQKGGSITRTIVIEQRTAVIKIYTLETFKEQTLYGTYISEKLTFAFDEFIHQLSINEARKSQRIQTFNQDTLSSVILSVKPSALDEDITVSFNNSINGKIKKGDCKTKVVKMDDSKVWLWSETDKSGFIIKSTK